MNVPNRITLCRIILSILLLVLIIFPMEKIGIDFPEFKIANVIINSKYLICGVIFMIASLTDFLDGYLARKYNLVTDLGKVMDAIADKVLVNGVLIVLAVEGYISVVVPVVIVSRDIFVDSIKMVAGQKSGAVGASKAGKFKTAFMLVGITLLFFQDIPFSLLGVNFVSRTIIMIATVLSVISGIQYYVKNKKYLFDTK
ncbi:cDP-diacylglycerol-glycerol-3-phosphate 3-phosphatidyltransferase [Clostridium sp. CAG:524]|jgi:CDP-diacylglycerol--glycerol-3-phosphate 3-phosphatidyltransferase|nr:CDP-diacylglycerol--glycerol-3-phosphate 3-phosphatidyltransferase [Clostridium sp.]CDA59973.1 cDP-diacylglycerol-glycerol-3-phosphate 3-phosphatidyltransferase [Clostridium sp. CAG:524]